VKIHGGFFLPATCAEIPYDPITQLFFNIHTFVNNTSIITIEIAGIACSIYEIKLIYKTACQGYFY